MPDINGLKFLENIKKRGMLKEVPVILYSNFIDRESMCKALTSGATAGIKKTKKVSMLAEMLESIFSINLEFEQTFIEGKNN